jgi:exodeoxyribonuclease VII large subunit
MSEETYTVAELSLLIGRVVARAFPDEIWVRGEIRDLTRAASGHVYFTLVDSDGEEAVAVMLPVTLFAADRDAVNRLLVRSGAMRMSDGVEVRVRGFVTHYGRRGTVQLRMTWIDPDYTLGRLAADRDRLLRMLRSRDLVQRNRRLPLPPVPLHVGLITSVGSAAHADFLGELRASGYRWHVLCYDSRVQGAGAAADISRGIRTLQARELDAIAIVRGGGAQTDLAAFDSEELALSIAHSTTPILTGIGHETDVTVAELVARGFKTPTACAAGLVGAVTAAVGRLTELAADIRQAARVRLDLAAGRLDHVGDRVARSSVTAAAGAGSRVTEVARRIERASRALTANRRVAVAAVHHRLAHAASRDVATAVNRVAAFAAVLVSGSRRRLGDATGQLDDLDHRVGVLDPVATMRRGWSITRDGNGVLILDPDQVAADDDLITSVAGGTIRSVVQAPDEVDHG